MTRSRLLVLLASMMFTAAVLASARPAPAAFPGANGKIAFTRGAQIYVMNADGTAQMRLGPEPSFSPAWSGDGSKLAFASGEDIYSMKADGSDVTRLTTHLYPEFDPAWSPDGSKVAFWRSREGMAYGNFEIYVMNADGSNLTALTDHPAPDAEPAWSPDGSKIAFKSARNGDWKIWVMNADGSAQTALTSGPFANEMGPDWSPDGSKIAFASMRDGDHEIYVMNADGSNQTRLTSSPSVDFAPAWSPDGAKLSFTSTRDGSHEIYVMNTDGSGVARLTGPPPTGSLWSAWQPLAPLAGNSCGEVRGDGRLDTNSLTRFVFYQVKSDGSSTPSGEISFSDRTTSSRLHFESTVIRTLVITGNHVTLTGSGIANGQPVDFAVEGDDGSPDRFSIRLSSGYSAAGAVAAGRGVNIKRC